MAGFLSVPGKDIERANKLFKIINDTTNIIVVCGLAALAFLTYYSYKHIQDGSRVYTQASQKADVNHDGITSDEEWLQVYKKLGISLPNNLTTSDLERYVEGK